MTARRTGGNTTSPTTGKIRRPGGRTSPGENGVNERFTYDSPNTTYRPDLGGSSPGTTAKAPRDIAFSSTIFNSDIPAVYGSNKVTGVCGFAYQSSTWLELMYAFSHGQQSGVTKVWVDDEEIYPTNTISDWIPYLAVHVGNGSGWGGGTRPAALLNAAEADRWKNLCHIYFAMRRSASNLSGSLAVKALVDGQIITDFRTAGTSDYTNPALVCYDIETNDKWRENDPARIDVAAGGTWWSLADNCDEEMSDSSKRYHFQGIVRMRDIDKAESEVLKHAFAEKYTDRDGVTKLFYRGLPPAISGTWTISGTNAAGTSGSADTELAEGDIVYIGSSLAVVTSVNGANDFDVDRSVTETGARTRLTSGIYLKKTDLVGATTGRDIPEAQIPDDVVVRYTPEDEEGGTQYPAIEDYTGTKRTEISLYGCKSKGMAKRYSETQKNVLTLQPFGWNLEVGEAAASLEPGDVFFFDDDGLTMQAARVLLPIKMDIGNGTYRIKAEEFDINAYSEGIATNDTVPSIDIDPPDAPTALTRTFGETGDWDSESMVSNPDDLTTAEGWAYVGTMNSTYNAGTDETEFKLNTTSAGTYAQKEYTSSLDGLNVLFVSFMIRALANWSTDSNVFIQYVSGSSSGTATVQQSVRVTPFVDGRYQRSAHKFALTTDAYHAIRVLGKQGAAVTGGSEPEFGIKRLRAVAWGLQGEPIETIYGAGNVGYDLGMYERFEWTEHSSAEDTVLEYQLRRNTAPGNPFLVINTVPVGGSSVEVDHCSQIQKWGPGAAWVAKGGTAEDDRGFYVKAVGPTGRESIFPTATETFEGSSTPPAISYMIEARSTFEPFSESAIEWKTTLDANPPFQDTKYIIPEDLWSDYWLELWVDEAGGTDYEIWARSTWPNPAWIGSRRTGHGEDQSGSAWPASGYSWEVRLRHKYTQKALALTAANGTTWLTSFVAASGTASMEGVPFVTGTTAEIETAVRAAGVVVPLIFLQSEDTTNARWQKLEGLPAYDDASAHGTMYVRVHSRGGTDTDDFVDEFMITNEDEATAAVVKWRSTNKGGTRQYSLQIWRQADKKDHIWIEAKNDPAALTVETLWLESQTTGGWPGFAWPNLVTLETDLSSWTTTAPSTGTLGFDSDSETPDFEFDFSGPTLSVDGSDVLTLAAGEFNAQSEKATPVDNDLVLVEDSAASYGKKKVKLSNLISGDVAKSMIDLYKGTGSAQSLGATWTDITWENERYKDSDFLHTASSAEIEFDFDGRVVIHCDMTTDMVSGTTRDQSFFQILWDQGSGYAAVPGSYAVNYNRTPGDGEDTCSIHVMLNVANGDKIKVQGMGDVASQEETVDDGCRLTIEKLTETAATSYNDDDAIHDDVAGEINALGAVTPTGTDYLILEDSSDSYNKKKVSVALLRQEADASHLRGDAVYFGIAPSDGDVLTWDNANTRWDAVAPSGGGGSPPADTGLLGTTVTPPTNNDYAYWTVYDSGTGVSGYLERLFNNHTNVTTAGRWSRTRITVDGTQLFEWTGTSYYVAVQEVAIGVGSVNNFFAPIFFSDSLKVEVYSYRSYVYSSATYTIHTW